MSQVIYDPTPRWIKIWNALSQLFNVSNPRWDHTLTNENESVSGRSWRNRDDPAWKRRMMRIDGFFAIFGDYDHSRASHQADVKRAEQLLLSEGYELIAPQEQQKEQHRE